ncbi:hypothetical protein G6F48_013494 [Rhizopus delemar]|nr:hypothetical protein G6F48_013494 [Rhizopus delemar]
MTLFLKDVRHSSGLPSIMHILDCLSDVTVLQQWQQQQLQQQQQQHPVQQPQQGQQYVDVAEINRIKKQCSDHIADHYREYLVGRGIKFDTLKSITDKANRKKQVLLHGG